MIQALHYNFDKRKIRYKKISLGFVMKLDVTNCT